MIDQLATATAVLASLIAAVSDLRAYRIPNRLTIPLLFSGLAYCLLTSGWWGLAASGAGAALGFGTLVGLYLAGGMGAGDVKLMTGLGAWLGPLMISDVLLTSCLVAGVYALVLLVGKRLQRGPREDRYWPGWRKCLQPGLAGGELAELAASPGRRRRLIPFGLVIFVGLLTTLARTHGLI